MKYSIIINPYSEKSDAVLHAFNFIQALRKKKLTIRCVFFYGYAVKYAFFNDGNCEQLANFNIPLLACSTIADDYLEPPLPYFKLRGLGQWMDAVLDSDKIMEFV